MKISTKSCHNSHEFEKLSQDDLLELCFELTYMIHEVIPEDWSGDECCEFDNDDVWRNFKIKYGEYDTFSFRVSGKGKFMGYIPDPKVSLDVMNILKDFTNYT